MDGILELCDEDPALGNDARTAFECLGEGNLLTASGETTWTSDIKKETDVVQLATEVLANIGYSNNGNDLTEINDVRNQKRPR